MAIRQALHDSAFSLRLGEAKCGQRRDAGGHILGILIIQNGFGNLVLAGQIELVPSGTDGGWCLGLGRAGQAKRGGITFEFGFPRMQVSVRGQLQNFLDDVGNFDRFAAIQAGQDGTSLVLCQQPVRHTGLIHTQMRNRLGNAKSLRDRQRPRGAIFRWL